MTAQLFGPTRLERRTHGEHAVVPVVPVLVVALDVALLLACARVLVDPGWAHLDGKAPVARALLYPLCLVVVPAIWAFGSRTAPFPWRADLLLTLTVCADMAGNRLNLYNAVWWFDDAMHVVGAALVSAAFVLLTLRSSAPPVEVMEAALAAGLTCSLGWELFEYGSFLTRSTEWTSAYSDTIGDLTLGWLGAAIAGVVLAASSRS